MSDIKRRLAALEREISYRKNIFAVRQDSDGTVYSDCFGERRRYYSLAEWELLYPGATVVDISELTGVIEQAERSKEDGKET